MSRRHFYYLKRIGNRLSVLLALLVVGHTFHQIKQTCVAAIQDNTAVPDDQKTNSHSAPKFTVEQLDFFESKIRPILVEHCYDCHGPDSDREGGLSVVSRKDLLQGGDTGPAIRPGDSQASLLIEALRHGERAQMPPDGKLPVETQADFIRWVEEKAPWPQESDIASEVVDEFDLEQRRTEHWAWQKISAGTVPAVQNPAWATDEIDAFILYKLETQHLEPAADSSPERWLRRVHFDLTGLPPTRRQWEEFTQAIESLPPNESGLSKAKEYRDKLGQAKARVVDQLLQSPTFGEHWARHWLDLVRYAETHGHEFDHPILNPHEYRDYVIRAFNSDISYQRLVAEHIAGDLLPNPRLNPEKQFNESVLGTSFWYLGEANHAPVDSLVDEAGRMDNQIDVLGKTFMGLTVACARCHDHKFDAISAADYHALAGIIQSTRRDVGVIDSEGQLESFLEAGQQQDKQFQQLVTTHQPELPTWNGPWVRSLLTEIDRQRQAGSESEDPVHVGTVESRDPIIDDFAKIVLRYAANETVDHIGSNNPIRHVIAYAQRPLGQGSEVWWESYREKLETEWVEESRTSAESQLLFSATDFAEFQWSNTGWSFRDTNTSFGLQNFSADNSCVSIDSRRWGENLPGTMRSPTFEITSPTIHLKIRGDRAKVRLVVDGYRMNQFAPLLFSELLSTESDDRWHWRTIQGDLRRYIGHNAFIEIIDEGPGGVAVSEIWMGKKPGKLFASEITKILSETSCNESSDVTNLYSTVFSKYPTERRDAEIKAAEADPTEKLIKWNKAEVQEFSRWLSLVSLRSQANAPAKAPTTKRLSEIVEARQNLDQQEPFLRTLYVSTAGSPEDQAIYIRGNTKNLGPIIPRGNLTAFHFQSDPQLLAADPTGRLQLAHQIADPSNPLTARVYVNRVWHWLMGQGIVRTTDNFGVLGELPTHPELLDYLAVEFMQQQWSTKQLVRRIVLSRAYGMSTQNSSEVETADPDNKLWHSARVKRLDAEAIRDSMIQIAGKLNTKMYGESVPTYLTDFMQGRGRPQSGPLDGNWRRSLYLEVRRNFMNPMMVVFDSPVPLSTTGNRNQSNVPAQSLTMLNDPLMEKISEEWAASLLRRFPGGGDSATRVKRIDEMFIQALGRKPSAREQERILEFLDGQKSDTETWKALAHAMFNLKEFIYLQ